MSMPAGSVCTTAQDELICVDENDQCIGFMEKQAAHEDGGVLHRAFSIFIFNNSGQILLQQRAHDKYHFGGRWTNTCCSHPRRDETLEAAAHRRLQEEMGIDTPLRELFSFIYRAHDEDSGLWEWEYDHVFLGRYDDAPNANPAEVAAWRWIDVADVRFDITCHPERYTDWFRIALDRVIAHLSPAANSTASL